jgi:3-deoxy-D-manno-octulosonate 8-phosphate phosphatase (KDO 8-P phosphatase)
MPMTLDAERARRVRMVGLDVDGVLTDGGIYLGSVDGTPLEFKRYDIQDGLGVRFLLAAGIRVVIITGRISDSVRLRGAELGVDAVVQDTGPRKLGALRQLADRFGVTLLETAFVGDDFPDLGVLREVGLPVAVGNAAPEVQAVAAVALERRGGHGAVREFAELLLRARGEWDDVVERYVSGDADSMRAAEVVG